MPSSLPALIFDLDGTLTDSKPGILGCLRKVIDARNIVHHGPLDRFIGPPVEEWVVALLPNGSEDDRLALARDYRACYDREGWRNNSVFPGIREMLVDLHSQGFPLYVCTSKQQHFAVRILDAFALSPLFTAIYGDKAEYPSHSKVDLLASLLRDHALGPNSPCPNSPCPNSPCPNSPCPNSPCPNSPCPNSPCPNSPAPSPMIGDRSFDIDAARANGLRSLAAAWGYGSPQECATADALAPTPAHVAALVKPPARNAIR